MNDISKSARETEVDVIVAGAGFAGLYALHKLRQLGLQALVLERGSGVGGTWFWNRYPGARCDVESFEYSYKFDKALQQEWVWSERYAAQPEILSYLNHVADRFDLRRDIRFDTKVVGADFHERSLRWRIRTENGDRFSARYFVTATGCLSEPNAPRYPGQERFNGDVYYTSRWPQESVDFTGRRVAIIGTGSSGVQATPVIVSQAQHVTVFQRTPNFSVPACNRPLTQEEIAKTKVDYDKVRQHALEMPFGFNVYARQERFAELPPEEREAELERRWAAFGGLQFLGAFNDILLDAEANQAAQDFVRRKIAQIVKDPVKAALLQPTDHPLGCKRLCSDSGYYECFNQPHVDLVDLRATPITAIEPHGIRLGDRVLEFDAIVYATGFDAITGALLKMNIVGRDGRRLNEEWQHGPATFLGIMSAGFPNLFMVTGPGSPSVLTNVVMAIEDHVDWIAHCIAHLEKEGAVGIEPTPKKQTEWMEHVTAIAQGTLLSSCNSWYFGSNIPGKPRAFSAYVGNNIYRQKIAEIAQNGFREFERIEMRSACADST